MNYENQICRGCGQPMHDGEDIVVCPECATPQHRECYNKLGGCVNGYLHASGYVWEPETDELTPAPEIQTQPNEEGFFCPICGTKNEGGATTCVQCGNPLPMRLNAQMPPLQFFGSMNTGENPFLAGTGIEDDYIIGGEKAGDIAVYLKRRQKRILPKFRKFSEKKSRISWNWGAFLLAPFYFFYRRMTKVGLAFFGVFVALSLLAAPSLGTLTAGLADSKFMNDYADYVAAAEQGVQIPEEQLRALDGEAKEAMVQLGNSIVQDKLLIACVCAFVILHIAAGLFADWFLYKKVLSDIQIMRDAVKEEFLLRSSLYKVGGTSLLNLLCSYFTYEIVCSALAALAERIIS